MIEIKPCPFCGGKGRIILHDNPIRPPLCSVECEVCESLGPPVVVNLNNKKEWTRDKTAAVMFWNTREKDGE